MTSILLFLQIMEILLLSCQPDKSIPIAYCLRIVFHTFRKTWILKLIWKLVSLEFIKSAVDYI